MEYVVTMKFSSIKRHEIWKWLGKNMPDEEIQIKYYSKHGAVHETMRYIFDNKEAATTFKMIWG